MSASPAPFHAPKELRQYALACLLLCDPAEKVAAVHAMHAAWHAGLLQLDEQASLSCSASIPGRPEKPELVPPLAVGRRSMATPQGRGMLIHALSHIEFNAINLALDALWRFAGMPAEYYADWLRVADEEATHFHLLGSHLQQLGFAYGDFAAHDSLWEMVDRTRDDVMARMALVPRTLEARGLDAIPPLRAKLAQAGDQAAAAILDIILRDEVGHVEIGNRWFSHLCQQRGLALRPTYAELALRYRAPTPRGPFNIEARLRAGFSAEELQALSAASTAA